MNKKTRKIIYSFTVMVCVAAVLIGVYYMVIQGKLGSGAKEGKSSKEVEKLLAKDLDTKYPETPTEVVKLYWRYNKCMYNNSISDKDLQGLLKQLRKLYDDEFLDAEENSLDKMSDRLKSEKKKYSEANKAISNYIVQPNSTVEYGTIDKRESATVISGTLTKAKSKREQTYEKFLCRRDDSGNWKILGWSLTTDQKDIATLGDN